MSRREFGLRALATRGGVPLTLLLMLACPAAGQLSLSSAGGKSSIVRTEEGFLSIDLAERSVGLNLLGERELKTKADPAAPPGFPTIPNLLVYGFRLAAAADQGRADIFQQGEFASGVEIGGSLTYVRENDSSSYSAFFVALQSDFLQNDYAFRETESSQVETGRELGTGIGIGVGFNYGFANERHVLGASATTRYDWNTAAGLSKQHVCTTTASGTDGSGRPVEVTRCADRYFGQPSDIRSLLLRADLISHIGRLGIGDPGEVPTIGSLLAVSARSSESDPFAFDLAAGPSIHKPGHPNEVIAAMLFELSDVTDSADTGTGVANRFGVRIFIGVPFDFVNSLGR